MPATDQSTMGEDGEGFRWNTTGESASSGGSSKAGHICLGEEGGGRREEGGGRVEEGGGRVEGRGWRVSVCVCVCVCVCV